MPGFRTYEKVGMNCNIHNNKIWNVDRKGFLGFIRAPRLFSLTVYLLHKKVTLTLYQVTSREPDDLMTIIQSMLMVN